MAAGIRRLGALVLAMVLAMAAAACAGKPGATPTGGQITIGVGGRPQLVYLPTTLAQQLGHYEQEGLQVKLEDLQGGSKALQGGSVDVVSGYYDHTIQMQAKQRDVTSFVTMQRYPSLVLAVSPLQWITQHSPEEIADKMPPEYAQGSREVYAASIARAKEAYSEDGAMQADSAEAVQAVLAQFIPEVQQADIDLAKTYSNDYLPGKIG
ncbi:MAG: ABC transporter substrate-binding protein [Pseudonocardiaceae bacterium]